MTRSVIKRIKRVIMVRIRRPFTLIQMVLILIILYLAKRSRDRHKVESRDTPFNNVQYVDHIDPNGGAGLYEDSEQGQGQQEVYGPVGDLIDSVNNKRDDVFPDIPQVEALPAADIKHKEEQQPVFISSQGLQPQEGVINQPINTFQDTQNAPPEMDHVDVIQSDAVQGAATYHFPVPGEELSLADIGGIPQAPEPAVYGPDGLEIIPKPQDMPVIIPERFSLDVTEEMINNFKVELPPLLPDYKNPCWIEQVPEGFTYDDSFFNSCHYVLHTNKLKHGAQYKAFENVLLNRTAYGDRTRIRCFPYFFLIGVGKCGTTDVYDTLKKYFFELAPIFLKEPHYWEWKRCIDKLLCRGSHRTPTFSEYLDSFDSASDYMMQKSVTRPDGTQYHDMVIGDFTPSILAFHPCWRHMPGNQGEDEPRYINAHYIKAIRPQSKFIAIMRDPVERIFSNFRMRDRMSAKEVHHDAEDFHNEMANVITYLKTCMETKTARACAFSIMKFDFGTHVTNSMYEIFITDWLKIFPRDQFLFLRMEDYMESRVPNFNNIINFLELDPMTPEKELMIGSKSVVNQAPPAAMFNETRTMLQDFFRPFNRRLADTLGDEGWLWGY